METKNDQYPIERNLDGVYFRVERDGKYESICFTDMTEEEQRKQLEGRPSEWLAEMCIIMAQVARTMADQFGIAMGGYDE